MRGRARLFQRQLLQEGRTRRRQRVRSEVHVRKFAAHRPPVGVTVGALKAAASRRAALARDLKAAALHSALQ